MVGLALIDVQTLTIKMCEVTVSNHYSNLEVRLLDLARANISLLQTILVQLGPKECLLPTFTSTEDNYLQLKKVIEKSAILVTERPKGTDEHRCGQMFRTARSSRVLVERHQTRSLPSLGQRQRR